MAARPWLVFSSWRGAAGSRHHHISVVHNRRMRAAVLALALAVLPLSSPQLLHEDELQKKPYRPTGHIDVKYCMS